MVPFIDQRARLTQHSRREGKRGRSWRYLLRAGALATFLACFFLPSRAPAQQEQRSKLPGLGKITSSAPTRQAFTGSVQSLDRQNHVLSVGGVQGKTSAIFPIRKKVKVSSANGQRLSLAALTPGTSILVYYEQKGGQRTVDQIIVLAPSKTKKKSHLSS